MDFVKEFAIFLIKNNALKFGDFTLSSGKKSSYYIDLRIVPSFPHQFRKMIKSLQNKIMHEIGIGNFDSLVSVPTSGLIIASALAIEIIKPLIYVRNQPKPYGTSKYIEGFFEKDMRLLMIDDVATTGNSVIKAIRTIKEENLEIRDAFVIIDRLEGAANALQEEGVKLHQVTDIMEISQKLFDEKLISMNILNKVKKQTGNY